MIASVWLILDRQCVADHRDAAATAFELHVALF